ncbi:MAG: BlaI/MecI/CopY family transcriptional regulator [Sedimentisphaerales bacterium]|nr:BlaI/MecI/CopY family transcriptional regulator [Sedimentisphaerales bacterium]
MTIKSVGTLQPLSPAETEILRLLWEIGSGTVQQVCEKLPPERQIAYATVQTLLRRLEKKGYVTHTIEGKAHLFRPHARREQVVSSAVTSFLERLFGGDPVPLVQHLARHNQITREDIERLKELIENRESSCKGTPDNPRSQGE